MGAEERAVEAISKEFSPGEKLVASVVATRVEQGSSGTERGALAVTNKRIVYQGGAWFGSSSRLQWVFGQISGVARTKNLMFEHIEINAGGAVSKFLVGYGEAAGFVDKANKALAESQNSNNQPGTTQGPPSGLSESLEKLAALHEKGLLSDDEFLAAKAKLLSD